MGTLSVSKKIISSNGISGRNSKKVPCVKFWRSFLIDLTNYCRTILKNDGVVALEIAMAVSIV